MTAGLLIFVGASSCRAADNPSQTVTVRVNLVVPQVTITKVIAPSIYRQGGFAVGAMNGLRISGPTGVVMRLNSNNGHVKQFFLGNGNAEVFTRRNLRGISSVELNYFGS